MGFEINDGTKTQPGGTDTDVTSALFESAYSKPLETSRTSADTSRTFDQGTSSGQFEVAAMLQPAVFRDGDQGDVLQVSDRGTANSNSAARRLQDAAHRSVGSAEYGNKVPRDAKEFANMDIPQNLQCASSSSDWLIEAGLMNRRDYKINVVGLDKWLGENGFKRVPLSGNFDISKFPDGPIGFISGKGNVEDGSNHVGFVEKRNGEVRVIHNNWRTGRVVDQNINEKFYDENGKPKYRNMSLYILPR